MSVAGGIVVSQDGCRFRWIWRAGVELTMADTSGGEDISTLYVIGRSLHEQCCHNPTSERIPVHPVPY
eukprot:6189221-Pleurochrysis_carterae.AAC.1